MQHRLAEKGGRRNAERNLIFAVPAEASASGVNTARDTQMRPLTSGRAAHLTLDDVTDESLESRQQCPAIASSTSGEARTLRYLPVVA